MIGAISTVQATFADILTICMLMRSAGNMDVWLAGTKECVSRNGVLLYMGLLFISIRSDLQPKSMPKLAHEEPVGG